MKMLANNSNEEEKIVIVKKIEGPSVDDEYDFVNVDSYDEEPQRSKIKLILLPLIALLVGGGAFYLTQNREKLLQSDKVVTSTTVKESETKSMQEHMGEKRTISIVEPKTQPVEVQKSTPKEKKNSSVVAQKGESKVEKKVSTPYIEELAMPTVVEKETKVEEVKTETIKEVNVENFKEVKAEKVVTKPKIHRVVTKKVTPRKPKVKKIIAKKRKPTLVAHYEKIKPRIIQVKKGDTLAVLAKRFYGNEMDYKRIVRANRRLKSGKTALRLGEKLVIPRKDNKKSRRYIIVEKGNTLAMIAKKFYRDEKIISKIVRANSKIKSSRSLLHLGQKVYVPR